METPKIKSLAKISEEAHMNGLRKSKSAKEMGELTVVGLGYVSSIVIDHIIEDRSSIHTSLVAAVEGMRPPKRVPPEGESVPLSVLMRDSHINQALEDTLTIINSIFKE